MPKAVDDRLRFDVNTRVDAATRDRLLEAARREERSTSFIVRRALRQYLDSLDERREKD